MKRILILVVMLLVGFWGSAEAEISPTPVSIKLLSPNGGEKIDAGSARRIAWKSSGVNSVMLYLTNPEGQILGTNLENVPGNPGYTYWVTNFVPIGSYKILIIGCAVASGCAYDQKISEDISDAPFDIIQPQIPIITQKASWYLPHVINSVVNNMEYFMRDFNGPAEYRILIDGVRTEGRIYLENYNLAGKTLKIYCLDGGELYSSEQQTIYFRAPGAKLIVEGCTIKNDYVPDPNQDPATRPTNAAIFAVFGPDEVQLRRNVIMSANTNGVSMSYVNNETLIGNEIHSPRVGVYHSSMGGKRVNRGNVIIGSAIAHFFTYTSAYPLPNDDYWYVALGGATTVNSKIPAEIKKQFNGELW